MIKLTAQFYEDNIYGYIKFRDLKQHEQGTRAQPADIKILNANLSREAHKSMRRAIANDINGYIKPKPADNRDLL